MHNLHAVPLQFTEEPVPSGLQVGGRAVFRGVA
jgi:hypothetical protein